MTHRSIAFIPVRGGSKSIPHKNVRSIAGRPLLHWSLAAAVECPQIDRVVVSTDSLTIANVAESIGSPKVVIHHRSEASATDEASTESVMLEYARAHDDFDTLLLIQATSPLVVSADLANALGAYRSGTHDSLLSVVRQKRFIWESDGHSASPVNHDPTRRPRRQEQEGLLVENGAFYLTSRERLLETGCRISGRIGVVEMDEASYYELDEPADWIVVESLLTARNGSRDQADSQAASRFADLERIRAVFTDCDGVLTDGGMYYAENGDELKRFNTRDGMGFEMLRSAGVIVGIVTSESVDLVARRGRKLALDEIRMGERDKLQAIRELCEKHSLDLNEVAYVGDDILDLPAIRAVGFGCSVADGDAQVKRAAAYVTRASGGHGALREVAELILAGRRR